MYPANVAAVASRFIELRTGIRVRVAESGRSDAPPVLLLHGWGASLYTFRHALDLLPQRGFRVIAADMRGFGLSDRPSSSNAYGLDAYVADLEALIDALHLERFALGGHSMGGGLSLRFALRRPERLTSLVLINPTGLIPTTPMLVVRVAPRPIAEAIGARLTPRWLVEIVLKRIAFGDASLVTPRDVDEYWAPTQIPGYIRAVRRTASEFDWSALDTEEAGSLAVPSIVILGTEDRLVRHPRAAAGRLRGASIREIVGGHCVHEEDAAEVYRAVAAHLQHPELPSSNARIV
jgi:pimeloyl-ACP methyl ester carboxylesterase